MTIRAEQISFPNGVDLEGEQIKNATSIELDSSQESPAYSAALTVDASGNVKLSVTDNSGPTSVEETIFDKDIKITYDRLDPSSVIIASSSTAGSVQLATSTEAQGGTEDEKVITPLTLASVTATETRAGLIELATQTEVNTGTDTARALTPATFFNSEIIQDLVEPKMICLQAAGTSNVSKYSDDTSYQSEIESSNQYLYLHKSGVQAVKSGTMLNIQVTEFPDGVYFLDSIIQNGYIYVLIQTTVGGTSVSIYRCSITSDISDISNWSEVTGVPSYSSDIALAGYGDGKFWIYKDEGIRGYTLSGSALTAVGSVISLSGSASATVNNAGIYAIYASQPTVRFVSFAGSLDLNRQFGALVTPSLFAFPNSLYVYVDVDSSYASLYIKIDRA